MCRKRRGCIGEQQCMRWHELFTMLCAEQRRRRDGALGALLSSTARLPSIRRLLITARGRSDPPRRPPDR